MNLPKMKSRLLLIIIVLHITITAIAWADTGHPENSKTGILDFQIPGNEKTHETLPGGKNRLVFSFGLGGGISYLKSKIYDHEFQWDDHGIKSGYVKPSISSNMRIGFAPSDKFFICWNARANICREVLGSGFEESDWLTCGGAGLGITFFPSGSLSHLYFSGLIGYSNLYNLNKGLEFDVNSFGTEIGIGAGYVFVNRFSVELFVQAGSSEKSYYNGSLRNPLVLNLTLNYIFWKPKKP